MNSALRIEVIKGKDLPSDEQKTIIALCNRAFEEELDALFSAFADSTHVLGYLDGMLVSHALWVTRWLRADEGPLWRTAYVEAVATEKAFRGLGFATAIMKRVEEEIQGYELGGLSPFSVAYYERLGWEQWRGPLYIRTGAGLVPTTGDEQVMILRLPKTPALTIDVSLSAEWREGELW
jgi:aminoglycoside 2'-N-acetyltransferase I